MKRRPTILDMERVTGYSKGMISRAFNKGYKINPETRDLILRKAREMGYVPHAGARSLIQGRAHRWGLLLPNLQNPRYSEIMEYLDLEARSRDDVIVLGLTRYEAEKEASLALHWASGEVDGIIVGVGGDTAVYEQLYRRRFPMVFLYGQPSPRYNAIVNYTKACREILMQKLLDAGHRRIAYVHHGGPEKKQHYSYQVYQKALMERGWYDESLVFFGSREYTAGGEAWAHWKRTGARPTAAFCLNDVMACHLIESVRQDGCEVPRDLSVVGSDDIRMASVCNLTTIRTDPAEIARETFALLERPFSRKGEIRTLHATLVERGSIAPPPPGGVLVENHVFAEGSLEAAVK